MLERASRSSPSAANRGPLGYHVCVGRTSIVERLDIAAWTTLLLLWAYALCWASFAFLVLELCLSQSRHTMMTEWELPFRVHLAPSLALMLSVGLWWWRRSRQSCFNPELEPDPDAGYRDGPLVRWREVPSVLRRAYVLHLQRLAIVLLLFWVAHTFPIHFGREGVTGPYVPLMLCSPIEYMLVKAEWLVVLLLHLPTRRLVLGQRRPA